MSTSSARTSYSTTEMTGSAKLEDVTRLMDKLTADLEKISLLPHQRDAHLEQLKVHGRDPANADPIFTRRGITTLTRHGFNSPANSTARNALRCLANAMLLRPATRQMFVDLGYEQKACLKLKNDSRDDEFLVSRIIFLTTYDTNINIEKMIDEYGLAANIATNLSRHSKQYITKQKKVRELDPMEGMALNETLKLMFNISHFCPQRIAAFSAAFPHLLILLANTPIISSKPFESPIGPLINSLLNIDMEQKHNLELLFPKNNSTEYVDRLIDLLDKSTKAYEDAELEQSVSPLLTLLRRVYEIGPRDVQKHMQRTMLPSDEDRKEILGRGFTLPSRILRLSTNPSTPQVRESISSLLFELSDKDARKFVQNVGYGFASGFLFQHNVAMPENALEAWSTSGSEDSARKSQDSRTRRGTRGSQESRSSSSRKEIGGRVNPVTGQLLEMEETVEMPEMTQEEKEREAERLFVLFERLKRTGVMKVQNPVAAAYQEGRFLELDDDAESE